MLVDISYTVEIDDIPTRVKDLYQKDVLGAVHEDSDLTCLLEKVATLLGSSDSPKLDEAREILTKLSKEFGKIQIRLKDIDAILRGYQKYKLGLHKASEQPREKPSE
jgi:hypothetical protein